MKRHLSIWVSSAILAAAGTASAAEVTRIVLPTSEDSNVGVRFMPQYRFSNQTGQIARESHCEAGVTADDNGFARCAEDAIVLNRELDWKQQSHFLDLDLRVGVSRRVEFGITLPIALSHITRYSYAEDISENNSTIDPHSTAGQVDLNDGDALYSTYHYFEVSDGYDARNRHGIGDLQLHVNFLAISQENNPNHSNLLLGLTYQAPTGKTRAGDSNGVGRGLHELAFRIAASRQIGFVEPYISAQYTLTAGNGGLFEKFSDNQMYSRPGHQIDLRGGLEFELHKDESKGLEIRLGLGAIAGIRTPGRDYSPLFEGFSGSYCIGATVGGTGVPPNGSPYNPAPGQANTECAWVTQQPANAANGNYGDTATPYAHNGITSVERHLYIGGEAELYMQFMHNIGMKLGLGYRAVTNHMITGENTGVDRNGDRTVDLAVTGPERNPYYNPTIDATGSRFLVEGFRRLDIDAALFVQF